MEPLTRYRLASVGRDRYREMNRAREFAGIIFKQDVRAVLGCRLWIHTNADSQRSGASARKLFEQKRIERFGFRPGAASTLRCTRIEIRGFHA